MEKIISKFALPLTAFAMIGVGILICMGIITLREGYIYYRAGIGCIAAGIGVLGYWAMANHNSDYNF